MGASYGFPTGCNGRPKTTDRLKIFLFFVSKTFFEFGQFHMEEWCCFLCLFHVFIVPSTGTHFSFRFNTVRDKSSCTVLSENYWSDCLDIHFCRQLETFLSHFIAYQHLLQFPVQDLMKLFFFICRSWEL